MSMRVSEFSSSYSIDDFSDDMFGDCFSSDEYESITDTKVSPIIQSNFLHISSERLEELRAEKQIDVSVMFSLETKPAYETIMDRSKYTGDWYSLKVLDEDGYECTGMEHLSFGMMKENRYQTKDMFYSLLVKNGYSLFASGKYTDWQTTMSLEQLVCLYFEGRKMDTIQVFTDKIIVIGSFEEHTFRKDSLFLKCFESIMCVVSSLPRNLRLESEIGIDSPNGQFVDHLFNTYGLDLSKYSSIIPATLSRGSWGFNKHFLDAYEGLGDLVLDLYFMEKVLIPNPKGRGKFTELRSGFLSNNNLMMNFIRLGFGRYFRAVSNVKEYANMIEIIIGMAYESFDRDINRISLLLDKFQFQHFCCPLVKASMLLPSVIVSIAMGNGATMIPDKNDIIMLSSTGYHICTLKNIFVSLYHYDYDYYGRYIPIFHRFRNQNREEIFKTVYDTTAKHLIEMIKHEDCTSAIIDFLTAVKNYRPLSHNKHEFRKSYDILSDERLLERADEVCRDDSELEKFANVLGFTNGFLQTINNDSACENVIDDDIDSDSSNDDVDNTLCTESDVPLVLPPDGSKNENETVLDDNNRTFISQSEAKELFKYIGYDPPYYSVWVKDEGLDLFTDHLVHYWFNQQISTPGLGVSHDPSLHANVTLFTPQLFYARVDIRHKGKNISFFATHGKNKKRAKLVAVTVAKLFVNPQS